MLARTDRQNIWDEKASFLLEHFAPLRDHRLKILGLSVQHNPLFAELEAFFPEATMITAGLDTETQGEFGGRIHTENLDPANIEDLVELGMQYGRFDVVFDDGAESTETQITALRTLFPFLRNGGYYIVYQLNLEHHNRAVEQPARRNNGFLEYLKKLVDLRAGLNPADIIRPDDSFLRTYGRSMNLTFFGNACLIQKSHKPAEAGQGCAQKPLAPLEGENLPVFISAWLTGAGNVVSETGSLQQEEGTAAIQGFLLHVQEDLQPHISYRGRLADGSWTGWMPCGALAGSRAPGAALTGFTVRLDEPLKRQLCLAAIGVFAGDPGLHIVRSGEDCVVRPEPRALRGIQIILREKRAIAA